MAATFATALGKPAPLTVGTRVPVLCEGTGRIKSRCGPSMCRPWRGCYLATVRHPRGSLIFLTVALNSTSLGTVCTDGCSSDSLGESLKQY